MRTIFLIFLLFTLRSQAQQTITGSFTHGGITRDYRVYIPASYNPGTAVPLLLNLHGYGSDNTQQEAYGDFRPIADTANFIIVHPNGTFDGSFKRYWNCFDASVIDDKGFLSALIDTMMSRYAIEPNRIYSTGMSNGGYMSYDMACFDNRIAAIASVTGSMYPAHKANCSPSRPVPAMQIHGTADMVVPYTGNTGSVHIDSLVRFWRDHNSCSSTPVYSSFPNTNTSDGCTAEKYLYTGGNGGSKVSFIKVIGGGHSWPGAPVNIAVTNHDFEASIEIWNFLREFRLDQLSSTGIKKNDELKLFPNPARDHFIIQGDFQNYVQVSIYNSNGKLVRSLNVTPNQEMDIRFLEAGIYFISFPNGEQLGNFKLVVVDQD